MTTYLIARLKVRYGQAALFEELFAPLVPVMEERGWKLHAAYHTLIGDLNEIIDVWEIPDASAVPTAMLDAATSSPILQEIAPRLAEVIVDEHLSVVSETAYSPPPV
jgi:hypothetical protein